jgi:hypothetical protein
MNSETFTLTLRSHGVAGQWPGLTWPEVIEHVRTFSAGRKLTGIRVEGTATAEGAGTSRVSACAAKTTRNLLPSSPVRDDRLA